MSTFQIQKMSGQSTSLQKGDKLIFSRETRGLVIIRSHHSLPFSNSADHFREDIDLLTEQEAKKWAQEVAKFHNVSITQISKVNDPGAEHWHFLVS